MQRKLGDNAIELELASICLLFNLSCMEYLKQNPWFCFYATGIQGLDLYPESAFTYWKMVSIGTEIESQQWMQTRLESYVILTPQLIKG